MRGKVSLNMTVCILVSSVLAFILALPIAFVLKSPLYEWKMSREHWFRGDKRDSCGKVD